MDRSFFWNRALGFAGVGCVAMTLLLFPMAVQVVRAEDGAGPIECVDVGEVTEAPAAPQNSPVMPLVKVEEEIKAPRQGIAGDESAPGVIVLNTRGYNYRSN